MVGKHRSTKVEAGLTSRAGTRSGLGGSHTPPAKQGAKLPARIPGLRVSIADISEA